MPGASSGGGLAPGRPGSLVRRRRLRTASFTASVPDVGAYRSIMSDWPAIAITGAVALVASLGAVFLKERF
ncbi:MAG TPA: hypothetical protein VMS00_00440, partial [Acidimicrobiales bacterium]|nr:hypothetical protein [Acidimicrobiales bacterium]